ncbi:DNA-3-methyladenine glycosylase I [Conyzicola nivalis]|uniref:DNA-3-methyladenine glycosylase I n=1 Tax=Conyzicola nivalis TaxID=1477021 RepID=A0A916SFL8_9MICO|nr:DNA-3-methyladenine glycosylase I [Conyzicola nivalis]
MRTFAIEEDAVADWRLGTTTVGEDGLARCNWIRDWSTDPALRQYHDDEWATPIDDPPAVFEALSLGVFQAGLGWTTVFHKRDAFRAAFHDFDPASVAMFTDQDVIQMLGNPKIVRNRSKIESTVHNARVVRDSELDLAALARAFVPADHVSPADGASVPTRSPEAAALTQVLKARGIRFIGPTSVYAWMQSIGVVNDHVRGCFRAGPGGQR